jgi:very-short-patch-repair endonuclease
MKIIVKNIDTYKKLIGQRFNKLLVTDVLFDANNRLKCSCLCDCGNTLLVTPSRLTSKHTKSCGCLRQAANLKYAELVGKKINKWTVRELHIANKTYKAICECDCGSIKEVNILNLVNGLTKDCGCGRRQKLSAIKSTDLLGQRFGKLLVTERMPESNAFKRVIYKCQCDCGNTITVASSLLLNGHTKSCGCLLSYYNMYIDQLLDVLDINHVTEYVVKIKNRNFRFDFYLPDYNLLIEYDGEVHYMPINFGYKDDFEAERQLKLRQQRDQLKNKYCAENNINLLRIPYWEKQNIEQIICNHLQRLSEKDVSDKLMYATV